MMARTYLFRDEWRTLKEIAALCGVCRNTARARISGDRVLEGEELKEPDAPEPPCRVLSLREGKNERTRATYTFDGKTLTIPQWAKVTGISANTLRERITYYRWPLERCLTEKPLKGGPKPKKCPHCSGTGKAPHT